MAAFPGIKWQFVGLVVKNDSVDDLVEVPSMSKQD
jgi:hypothetical protein